MKIHRPIRRKRPLETLPGSLPFERRLPYAGGIANRISGRHQRFMQWLLHRETKRSGMRQMPKLEFRLGPAMQLIQMHSVTQRSIYAPAVYPVQHVAGSTTHYINHQTTITTSANRRWSTPQVVTPPHVGERCAVPRRGVPVQYINALAETIIKFSHNVSNSTALLNASHYKSRINLISQEILKGLTNHIFFASNPINFPSLSSVNQSGKSYHATNNFIYSSELGNFYNLTNYGPNNRSQHHFSKTYALQYKHMISQSVVSLAFSNTWPGIRTHNIFPFQRTASHTHFGNLSNRVSVINTPQFLHQTERFQSIATTYLFQRRGLVPGSSQSVSTTYLSQPRQAGEGVSQSVSTTYLFQSQGLVQGTSKFVSNSYLFQRRRVGEAFSQSVSNTNVVQPKGPVPGSSQSVSTTYLFQPRQTGGRASQSVSNLYLFQPRQAGESVAKFVSNLYLFQSRGLVPGLSQSIANLYQPQPRSLVLGASQSVLTTYLFQLRQVGERFSHSVSTSYLSQRRGLAPGSSQFGSNMYLFQSRQAREGSVLSIYQSQRRGLVPGLSRSVSTSYLSQRRGPVPGSSQSVLTTYLFQLRQVGERFSQSVSNSHLFQSRGLVPGSSPFVSNTYLFQSRGLVQGSSQAASHVDLFQSGQVITHHTDTFQRMRPRTERRYHETSTRRYFIYQPPAVSVRSHPLIPTLKIAHRSQAPSGYRMVRPAAYSQAMGQHNLSPRTEPLHLSYMCMQEKVGTGVGVDDSSYAHPSFPASTREGTKRQAGYIDSSPVYRRLRPASFLKSSLAGLTKRPKPTTQGHDIDLSHKKQSTAPPAPQDGTVGIELDESSPLARMTRPNGIASLPPTQHPYDLDELTNQVMQKLESRLRTEQERRGIFR